ncbi:hypothetical protein K435DRAFT_870648 [Dendrothele bispora CBS 962.96]|uniref:Uncharacterized protein n=1 Tax=Dendrothele bispora (strain CBS 962.96) TaxID=1314807 RepID=A0A4S8L6I2_DENBC|nr:hypothetical protein K435DRAFT_870648 [Dendrothele bispora CBS 962.96]
MTLDAPGRTWTHLDAGRTLDAPRGRKNLGAVYTNGFLATLNSRNHLRNISCIVDSWHISSTGVRNNFVDTRPGTSQVMNISTDNGQFDVTVKYGSGVRIGTETLIMTDLDTSAVREWA